MMTNASKASSHKKVFFLKRLNWFHDATDIIPQLSVCWLSSLFYKVRLDRNCRTFKQDFIRKGLTCRIATAQHFLTISNCLNQFLGGLVKSYQLVIQAVVLTVKRWASCQIATDVLSQKNPDKRMTGQIICLRIMSYM
jgi:hypothetical protein